MVILFCQIFFSEATFFPAQVEGLSADISFARSDFEERRVERAPFEKCGGEAGVRSFLGLAYDIQ